MATLDDEPGAAASALMGVAGGFHVARALHLAAELRLADLVAGGAKSPSALAAAAGTQPDALLRLMRLLVCAGIFAQDEQGAFALTPVSLRLQSGVPGSLRDAVLFHLGREAYQAWAELDYTLRTGNTAFDRALGMGVWQYRGCHAEYAALFDRAMSDFAGVHIDAILAAYSFASLRGIVDIGGGTGKLLAEVLAANPGLDGVLFDLPHVASRARQYLADAGLAERCRVVEGDMFSGVPAGADAYVLSRVIHDWDDPHAVTILRNCRRAMPAHGRVLVVERLLPSTIQPSAALRSLLVSDLTMMVMNGGRERTEAQYRDLFSRADLAVARSISTQSGITILEASAAGAEPN